MNYVDFSDVSDLSDFSDVSDYELCRNIIVNGNYENHFTILTNEQLVNETNDITVSNIAQQLPNKRYIFFIIIFRNSANQNIVNIQDNNWIKEQQSLSYYAPD